MNYAKLTHATGVDIYINPQLVRAVMTQGAKGSRLIFDPAHEVNVKEDILQVMAALRQAT